MSQKDFEILQALKPLETLWGVLSEAQGRLYTQHLTKFPIEVIHKAVSKVSGKWEKVSFPPVGLIVKHCELLNAGGATIGTGDATPWLTRKRNQDKAVSEYMLNARTSALMQQAAAEGWDYHLEKYLREVAGVQAQMLFPASDGRLGLCWHRIQIDGLTREQAQKWQEHFLEEMRRQLNFNNQMINVDVPNAKIEEWRRIRTLPAGAAHG